MRMFKTEEYWKRANFSNTLDEIQKKVNNREEVTKFELTLIAEYLKLPEGVCLCQNKFDGSIVMDHKNCSTLDSILLDLWFKENKVPDSDKDIKDVCSGTYVKV